MAKVPTKAAKSKAAAARKTKAMLRKVAAEKAADATPPASEVSRKAHPRVAALKGAGKPVGAGPERIADSDTAAAKSRNHALTGRSHLNFRG